MDISTLYLKSWISFDQLDPSFKDEIFDSSHFAIFQDFKDESSAFLLELPKGQKSRFLKTLERHAQA